MSTYIVRTLLPYITANIGGSEIDVSRVLYISFIVLAFMSPIAGWLCDVFGAWRVLVISSIIIASIIPLYLYVTDVNNILLIRFIHSLLGSLALAAALTIASWITSRGGVGIGFLRLSQGMGISLGPMVAGFLASIGYFAAFITASILTLTTLTALLIRCKEERRNIPPPWTSIRYVAKLLKLRAVVTLLPLAIAEAFSFTILITYYTPYLTLHLKFSEQEYALFLFLEAMVFGIGSYISEPMYRRYGKLLTYTMSLGMLISYILLCIVKEKLMIIAVSPIIGLFSSFTLNPVYIEASKRLTDEIRGLGINLIDLVVNISLAFVAPLEILVLIIGFGKVMLIPVIIITSSIMISIFASRELQ